MKKLTTFMLSAAFVPALALSTTAMAEKHDTKKADGEQRTEQQRVGEQEMTGQQHGGQRQLSSAPAGAVHANDLIGQSIKHRTSDEEIGEIQDLVIGQDGRIVGVIVKSGTFLGLGGQDVSLNWDQVKYTMEGDESVFHTDVDEEALRESPKYERD
ncbi:PRC-barrel domain-containing protein [Halomonas mongoliensis]|uniref:PRC-barrel domain-containing protein n=1 Tax=Halomonas mongoliensis TaxID=321265 RepID=A0ABU1GNI1_9GAMM|nr:PRC-barrel domain-containing protein [Halomonas mongoliensis]MDR5893595.1 PRC-barrel domain-containing protein [Halomonas mongoliensis]